MSGATSVGQAAVLPDEDAASESVAATVGGDDGRNALPPADPARARLCRRVLRRETVSARSLPIVVLAALGTLALAWIVIESVLVLLGREPLLLSLPSILDRLIELPAVASAPLIGVGVILATLGAIVLLVALTPGRSARHGRITDRSAVLVDDRAVAAALAATAARAARVGRGQVRASVGRRSATIEIRPTSGVPVDAGSVSRALDAELASAKLTPAIAARVRVSERGVVGA